MVLEIIFKNTIRVIDKDLNCTSFSRLQLNAIYIFFFRIDERNNLIKSVPLADWKAENNGLYHGLII